MSRLFVDVDDTLILWPKVAESRHLISGESAKPNPDVIEFIGRWLQYNPDGQVIVWSLGGAAYARTMTRKNAPRLDFVEAFWDKEPIARMHGDTFIDDDPLVFYRAGNIHPDMLRGLTPINEREN